MLLFFYKGLPIGLPDDMVDTSQTLILPLLLSFFPVSFAFPTSRNVEGLGFLAGFFPRFFTGLDASHSSFFVFFFRPYLF